MRHFFFKTTAFPKRGLRRHVPTEEELLGQNHLQQYPKLLTQTAVEQSVFSYAFLSADVRLVSTDCVTDAQYKTGP